MSFPKIENRHLGNGPEKWEQDLGDTDKRVIAIGKDAKKFLKILNKQKDKKNMNDALNKADDPRDHFVKHVHDLGKESLKLIEANLVNLNTNHELKDTFFYDSDTDNEEWHDSGDEEIDLGDTNPNQELDMEWDTTYWTATEIESSCGTLVDEIENSFHDPQRNKLSVLMLTRLCTRHGMAINYIDKMCDSLCNKAFPNLLRGITESCWGLSYLFESLSNLMPLRLLRSNVVPRIVKMLQRENELAALIIQIYYRMYREKKKLQSYSHYRRIRTLHVLIRDELKRKWEIMHSSPTGGRVPGLTFVSYMNIFKAMSCPGKHAYYRVVRKDLVEAGGVHPLVNCLKKRHSKQEAGALKVLLEISTEPTLLRHMLKSELTKLLKQMLSLRNRNTDDILKAIEIFDMLAFNAYKYSELVKQKGMPDNDTWDTDDDDYEADDDEQEEWGVEDLERNAMIDKRIAKNDPRRVIPLTDLNPKQTILQSIKYIDEKLGDINFIQHVLKLLKTKDFKIFLGACCLLHKLACTTVFETVLTETLAVGGSSLMLLCKAMSQHEEFIPVAVTNVILQFSITEEARDKLIGKGMKDLMGPLIYGKRAGGSQTYVLALLTMVSLLQNGDQETNHPGQIDLDMTLFEICDKLYKFLLKLFVHSKEYTRETMRKMKLLFLLEPILNFLCRLDEPSHYYTIDMTHRYIGCIILHRMTCSFEVCQRMVHERAVVKYLCCNVISNYISISDNEIDDYSEDAPLFYISLHSAFQALAKLAMVSEEARLIVAMQLNEQKADEGLSGLLQDHKDLDNPMNKFKLAVAESAGKLLAAITPDLLVDMWHDINLEPPFTEEESEKHHASHLQEICGQYMKALTTLVYHSKNIYVIGSACRSLTKLSVTNDTIAWLISQGLIDVLYKMVPFKPSIVYGVESDFSIANETAAEKLLSVTPPVFGLIASLSRNFFAREKLMDKGFLYRAIERFHMTCGKPKTDLWCYTEIALFFANMAQMKTRNSGQANDFLLSPKFRVVEKLVWLFTEQSHPRKTKFYAIKALGKLSEDSVRTTPVLIKTNLLKTIVEQLDDMTLPQPFQRQCLSVIKTMAQFPLGQYIPEILETEVRRPLVNIGSKFSLEVQQKGNSQGKRETIGSIARDSLWFIDKNKKVRQKYLGLEDDNDDLSVTAKMVEEMKKDRDEKVKAALADANLNPTLEEEEYYEDYVMEEEEVRRLSANGTDTMSYKDMMEDAKERITTAESETNTHNSLDDMPDATYDDCGPTSCGSLLNNTTMEDHGKPKINPDTNMPDQPIVVEHESHDKEYHHPVSWLTAKEKQVREEVIHMKDYYEVNGINMQYVPGRDVPYVTGVRDFYSAESQVEMGCKRPMSRIDGPPPRPADAKIVYTKPPPIKKKASKKNSTIKVKRTSAVELRMMNDPSLQKPWVEYLHKKRVEANLTPPIVEINRTPRKEITKPALAGNTSSRPSSLFNNTYKSVSRAKASRQSVGTTALSTMNSTASRDNMSGTTATRKTNSTASLSKSSLKTIGKKNNPLTNPPVNGLTYDQSAFYLDPTFALEGGMEFQRKKNPIIPNKELKKLTQFQHVTKSANHCVVVTSAKKSKVYPYKILTFAHMLKFVREREKMRSKPNNDDDDDEGESSGIASTRRRRRSSNSSIRNSNRRNSLNRNDDDSNNDNKKSDLSSKRRTLSNMSSRGFENTLKEMDKEVNSFTYDFRRSSSSHDSVFSMDFNSTDRPASSNRTFESVGQAIDDQATPIQVPYII